MINYGWSWSLQNLPAAFAPQMVDVFLQKALALASEVGFKPLLGVSFDMIF